MEAEFQLTQAAADKLKEDLKYLRTVRRQEVSDKIKEAKSFGDLSENSEYDEAKSEQGKLEAEITELEYTLQHVKIIDEALLSTDAVHIGSIVTVTQKGEKSSQEFHIVGAPQADFLEGKISNDSPLGEALLGHKKGDTVTVHTPGGILEYKINKIAK